MTLGRILVEKKAYRLLNLALLRFLATTFWLSETYLEWDEQEDVTAERGRVRQQVLHLLRQLFVLLLLRHQLTLQVLDQHQVLLLQDLSLFAKILQKLKRSNEIGLLADRELAKFRHLRAVVVAQLKKKSFGLWTTFSTFKIVFCPSIPCNKLFVHP